MTRAASPAGNVAGSHMVFALAKRDGALLAFATGVDAASFCEEKDVKDAVWLFFADDGSPLEARFELPKGRGNATVDPGGYTLQRAMSGLWLQERLAQVRKVGGCGLDTVAELVELLKVNRGKRIPPGARRG